MSRRIGKVLVLERVIDYGGVVSFYTARVDESHTASSN